mmetsp:Transcript_104445/g.196671  ORF Transcript_104445/g.196671 Transcript_104445/m.196671 type:complete len:163 (-) Transcript_104445:75-563(-)
MTMAAARGVFTARLASSALRSALPYHRAPAFNFLRAFSDNVKFAKTHEWLLMEDGTGTLGISKFAADALGEVVYVDLPSEGDTFGEKETMVTLESVKAVGEVYAPCQVEILEVNEVLGEEPAKVNSSPEEDGWLVKVKYSGDTSALMDRDTYLKFADSQAEE